MGRKSLFSQEEGAIELTRGGKVLAGGVQAKEARKHRQWTRRKAAIPSHDMPGKRKARQAYR